jgi:hypothetical protein
MVSGFVAILLHDRFRNLRASIVPFMRGMELAAIALALGLANHAAIADVVAVVSSKSAIGALSKSQAADIFLVRPPISPRASKL